MAKHPKGKAAKPASRLGKLGKLIPKKGAAVAVSTKLGGLGKFLITKGVPAFAAFSVAQLLFGETAGRKKAATRTLLESVLLGDTTGASIAEAEQENLSGLLEDVLGVQTQLGGVARNLDVFSAAQAEGDFVKSQLNQISDLARASEPSIPEQIARMQALLG